jgi:hypothetical protein
MTAAGGDQQLESALGTHRQLDRPSIPERIRPVMVNQDGTPYVGDRLSPRMLGQRHAQRGRPSPPLYNSRAQIDDYAAGWYEYLARPAPDTLHRRWRWIRLQRMWRQGAAFSLAASV